jgi:hypothetical protein
MKISARTVVPSEDHFVIPWQSSSKKPSSLSEIGIVPNECLPTSLESQSRTALDLAVNAPLEFTACASQAPQKEDPLLTLLFRKRKHAEH